jgi:hypothetical protein
LRLSYSVVPVDSSFGYDFKSKTRKRSGCYDKQTGRSHQRSLFINHKSTLETVSKQKDLVRGRDSNCLKNELAVLSIGKYAQG